MFRVKNETFLLSAKIFKRNFSKTSKNLYDVLEVHRGATQADIKASYYKLSKMYHPDVNKDNLDASEKFRLITEAYEVLGNFRLRKLYDKGIIHTAGKDYSHHASPADKTSAYDHAAEEEYDDATTKFYKSRLRRPHTPSAQKIYDFDEWTKQHYSDTFQKSKFGKDRHDFKKSRNAFSAVEAQSLNLSGLLLIGIICFIVIAEYLSHQNQDRDRIRRELAKEESDKKKV